MKKAILLCSCLEAATIALAVNPAKVDSLKLKELQEVQVVSTRASQKVPMAFTNLKMEDIKDINFGKDLPFLLSLTPSALTSSDAGTGIGYTSLRVRGTDATRINVTANGIPINDAESNDLYWVNMPDFASGLNSVQIQRGVGTSTNGSGAFGASVNMQTENIADKAYVNFDASAGSYGSHKETLRFGSGLLNGHWGFSGRLSNIGSDGYIRRASARLNSYFFQGGYFGETTVVKFITFNGTEKTYHAWDYATKEDMEEYGRRYNPCGKYKDANGQTAFYDDQTDNYHQQHYQLLWNQLLSSQLNLNVALHYTRDYGYYEQYKKKQELYQYLLTTTPADSVNDLIRRKLVESDFYGTVF
ncbi:MAG: TonB-dependent receptor plug domain-containing protein, partial [Bacteroidaceae bacterium]|nr:TonB-dependent receptor plug domain-containing protein [Bacteroidaceae bacterium]